MHFTKKFKKNIFCFNAQQFNSLDCLELHSIAHCWFAMHCNILDCTPPLLCTALHSTALHWVKFLNLNIIKIYIILFHYFLKIYFIMAALLLLNCSKVWYVIYEYFLFSAVWADSVKIMCSVTVFIYIHFCFVLPLHKLFLSIFQNKV